jgi:hypothetical protein
VNTYIVFALDTSLQAPELMVLTTAIMQAESEEEAANRAPSLGIAPPTATEYHVCDLAATHSFNVSTDTSVVYKEGANVTEAFAAPEAESVPDGE